MAAQILGISITLVILALCLHFAARIAVRSLRFYYSWQAHYREIDRIKKAGNQMSILNPKWSGMPNSKTYLAAMKP